MNKATGINDYQTWWDLVIMNSPNAVIFRVQDSNGTTSTLQTNTTDALTINAWNHVAAVFDGATMSIYVNGTLLLPQLTIPNFVAPIATSSAVPVWIGSAPYDSTVRPFGGYLFDLRLYQRKISISEIQEQFDCPFTGIPFGIAQTTCVYPSGPPALTSADNYDVHLIQATSEPALSSFPKVATIAATSASSVSQAVSVTTQGQWWWYVVARNPLLSTTSSVASFIVCPNSAPVLLSPAPGAVISLSSLTQVVTFTWQENYPSSLCSYTYNLNVQNQTGVSVTVTNATLSGQYFQSKGLLGVNISWNIATPLPTGYRTLLVCLLAAPAVANLTSPANLASFGYTTSSVVVSFTLPSSFGNTCTTSPTFAYYVVLQYPGTQTIVTGSATVANISAPVSVNFTGLPSAASFSWFVIFSNGYANSTSASWGFNIGQCQVVAPSSPTLVTPYDGFTFFGTAVTLAWSLLQKGNPCVTPVQDAFQVQYSQTFPTNPFGTATNISSTSSLIELTSPPWLGTFYWWVVYINNVSKTNSSIQSIDWCSTQSFLSPPALQSPVTNGSTVLNPVSFSWAQVNAPAGCNGFSAQYSIQLSGPSGTYSFASDTTSFSFSGTLTPGAYALDITASLGYYTSATTNVLYVCSPQYPEAASLVTPVLLTITLVSMDDPATLTWLASDFVIDADCAPGTTTTGYEVYVGTTPSINTTVAPACTTTTALSCQIQFTEAVNYWLVVSYKEVAGVTYTATSVVAVFAICIPLAPSVPTLVGPSSGSVIQALSSTTPISLSWTPIPFAGYGQTCGQLLNPQTTIYVDTNAIPTTQLDTFFNQSLFSLRASFFTYGVQYHWRIEVSNGLTSTYSTAWSFEVAAPVDAPTATGNPLAENATSLGEIVGIVVACAAALVIGILAVVLYMRRGKFKKESFKEPDYEELAFVGMTFPFIAGAFTRKNADHWAEFEQLILAQDRALLNTFLQSNCLSSPQSAQALFFTFAKHNLVVELESHLVAWDLAHAGDRKKQALIGPNATSSRVFTLFCRQIGLPYLYLTFRPFMEYLQLSSQDDTNSRKSAVTTGKTSTMSGSGMDSAVELGAVSTSTSRNKLLLDTLEIDNRLLQEGVDEMDIRSNALTLELTLEKLLNAIYNSIADFPV